jgi:hypothetical protein
MRPVLSHWYAHHPGSDQDRCENGAADADAGLTTRFPPQQRYLPGGSIEWSDWKIQLAQRASHPRRVLRTTPVFPYCEPAG